VSGGILETFQDVPLVTIGHW